MTTQFNSFNFAATGSTALRSLPNRLAETHNVKDFGAVGDGVADDWQSIMNCLNWARFFLTTSTSNQTATFTGAIASASFTGTISGNNLTINSGLVGTVAVGQTISGSGVTSCQITSGSGTSWVVNGSPQTVGPVAMTTNCVLTASSVTGTINVNNAVLNNGGTDASPSTINFFTQISSQQSGTAGGAGVYVLDSAQNFSSQAMMTVTNVLTFASTSPLTFNQFAFDANNTSALGDGISNSTRINSFTGTTITLASINGLVNAGDSIGIDTNNRGTIYFPPGTYSVSKPISFNVSDMCAIFAGELGLSVITGNFADYVFTRSGNFGIQIDFDKLTITNTNATGGGIRYGGNTDGGAIRNCTITANKGINTYNVDNDPSFAGSFELAIENCVLSSGSNFTGSQGLMLASDGPVINCRLIGFDTAGIQMARGAQAQFIVGCYFEQCTTAILSGARPDGVTAAANSYVVAGCWFKNCGTVLQCVGAGHGAAFRGIVIEGTNGQAHGGSDPQYGIFLGTTGSGTLPTNYLFEGISISGQFDQACVYTPGQSFAVENIFKAVQATNSGTGMAWKLNDANMVDEGDQFIACNQNNIIKVANLPSFPGEGSTYNVSDGTDGLSWSNTVTNTGSHTTHYKVRGNGSNWTVVGT